LIAGSRAVDEKLSANGVSAAVVALRVDSSLARIVLTVAGPGDDEVAAVVDGDRGIHLIAGRLGVHQELTAERVAVRGEALRVDTVHVAVLVVACPGDDVVTRGVHRHHGLGLRIGRDAIDHGLGTERRRAERESSIVDTQRDLEVAAAGVRIADGDRVRASG
jgi:hypothetical protein